MNGVWIGTSGWSYKSWAPTFYPEGCKDELGYYVTQFPTVEINATFYRLATFAAVKNWAAKAPPGFVFAVKGSRYITHIKRLHAVAAALQKFFRRVAYLRQHTGPLLWQLPPNMKLDLARLEKFLQRLPKKYRHAVEFREPSWITGETFDLLRRYQAAYVWLSSQRMPMNTTMTADFVYLRFHGLEGGANHNYTDKELKVWATPLREAAATGHECFAYFNNDISVHAIFNALTLMKMLGEFAIAPVASKDHKRGELAIS